MIAALATWRGLSRKYDMVRAMELPLPSEDLTGMSVRKKKAEQIVSGLAQPINLHLLKLLGCEADDNTRRHWKRELGTWLLLIAAIRLKPDNKRLTTRIAFDWLYDETFGGAEQSNTGMMLRFLARDYPRNEVDTATVAKRMREVHELLSDRIAHGDPGDDIIEGL
jgi:hypothetical protein